jgi:ABC-2 type transport system permease protein
MIEVVKKEIKAYFSTPFGFIFMGIFLLMSGIAFTTYNLLERRADIYGMLGIMRTLSITAFPILTMKLLAEERHMGTDQLLLTSRLSVIDVVVGKYLAALCVLLVTLLANFVYVVMLFIYGEPTIGAILGSYAGFFLLGASFTAICIFASSLTDNQVTSAIAAFGVLFALVVIGSLSGTVTVPVLRDFISALSVTTQFEELTRGVFRFGPLAYYICFAVGFVSLTVRIVERRRWSGTGGQMRDDASLDPPLLRRSFRLTLKAIVSSILVLGILIFATLLAYEVPWSYDMTKDKLFTLSEQSLSVLSRLESTVNIAAVYPVGGEDPMIRSLLFEYSKAGRGKIAVEYVDAERDPGALSKYRLDVKAVLNGSLIFESGERTKILNVSSLYQRTPSGLAFSGEHQVTGAITFVTTTNVPRLFFVEGHEEASIEKDLPTLKQRLEVEAYQVERINLLRQAEIPREAAMLIIPSPKHDYTLDEIRSIDAYLAEGGRAIFLLDVLPVNERMTNIKTVLAKLGLGFVNNFTVEENPRYYYSNNKLNVIPAMGLHEITQSLLERKMYVILPVAMALRQMPQKDDALSIETLLQTTETSWVRTDVRINNTSMTAKDDRGPADVAFAIVKNNAPEKMPDTRVVVIGNSTFLTEKFVNAQGNLDFFINAVNWVQGSRDVNTIRPREVNADALDITGRDFLRLAIISVGVLPMLAFAAAFLIWALRRNL